MDFYSDPQWQPAPQSEEIARKLRFRYSVVLILVVMCSFLGIFNTLSLGSWLQKSLGPEWGNYIRLGVLILCVAAPFLVWNYTPATKCPCCDAKMVKARENTPWQPGSKSLFLTCQQCKRFVDLKITDDGVS